MYEIVEDSERDGLSDFPLLIVMMNIRNTERKKNNNRKLQISYYFWEKKCPD